MDKNQMDENRIEQKQDWTKNFGLKPVGRKEVGRKLGARIFIQPLPSVDPKTVQVSHEKCAKSLLFTSYFKHLLVFEIYKIKYKWTS